MPKFMAGYCWSCCENTKQEIIDTKDLKAYRIFEAICTLGLSFAFPVDYRCECTKCGQINTLQK